VRLARVAASRRRVVRQRNGGRLRGRGILFRRAGNAPHNSAQERRRHRQDRLPVTAVTERPARERSNLLAPGFSNSTAVFTRPLRGARKGVPYVEKFPRYFDG